MSKKNKYNIKDIPYDIAYLAVLLGLLLFIIGSFPEFFDGLLNLNKLF